MAKATAPKAQQFKNILKQDVQLSKGITQIKISKPKSIEVSKVGSLRPNLAPKYEVGKYK